MWISNIKKERNLAFYLVESGYDVWMGNARGNKYSQWHLTKNPNNADFWEFSMDEFAMLDMPDTIDVRISDAVKDHIYGEILMYIERFSIY